MRRILVILMASGLAVACGALSVIVYTVFLTPERPRPATPTVIAVRPAEPTGTPRGEARPLFTPTPADPAPSATPMPTRPTPTAPAAPAPSPSPAAPTVEATAAPAPPTPAPAMVRPPGAATPAPTSAAPAPPRTPTRLVPTPTRPAPTATRPAPTPTPTRAPAATPTPTRGPARLQVTPNRVALRPGQRAVVTLGATAGPPLAWRAVAEVAWLAVQPASGVLREDPGVLTIEMRQPGPPASVREGRVIVEAGGERAVVVVALAPAATP